MSSRDCGKSKNNQPAPANSLSGDAVRHRLKTLTRDFQEPPMRSLIPSFWGNDTPNLRDPFQSLRSEMSDMMGYLERRFPTPRNHGATIGLPVIDIAETKDALEVSAELPGVSEKDVSVTLDRDRLIISGEKKQESEQKGKDFYVMERSYGSFHRVIPLDFMPDTQAVDAEFQKGILKVTVKKPADITAKAKSIPVRSTN
jgi:HSP20 family protein